MSDIEPPRWEKVSARLTQVEELYTHFERKLEDLDEVARHLQERLDTLEAGMRALRGRVDGIFDEGAEDGSIEDERPPHY